MDKKSTVKNTQILSKIGILEHLTQLKNGAGSFSASFIFHKKYFQSTLTDSWVFRLKHAGHAEDKESRFPFHQTDA